MSFGSALLVAAVAQPSFGAERATESFQTSFPIYANGGAGFAGPWIQGGFNAFDARYFTRAVSLCYAPLSAGAGGSIASPPVSSINGSLRDLAQSLGANNTTIYVSFLVQPRGTLNEGVFNGFFGLTLNGSLGNELFIGKAGGGVLDRYVLENRGGAGQIASDAPVVVGDVALLVVKAQFLPGLDVFTLYTNPPPGKPEPSVGVAKTDLDLGTVSKIGIYSTGAFTIDELRIGTTYEDVVPTGGNSTDPDFPGCAPQGR